MAGSSYARLFILGKMQKDINNTDLELRSFAEQMMDEVKDNVVRDAWQGSWTQSH